MGPVHECHAYGYALPPPPLLKGIVAKRFTRPRRTPAPSRVSADQRWKAFNIWTPAFAGVVRKEQGNANFATVPCNEGWVHLLSPCSRAYA